MSNLHFSILRHQRQDTLPSDFDIFNSVDNRLASSWGFFNMGIGGIDRIDIPGNQKSVFIKTIFTRNYNTNDCLEQSVDQTIASENLYLHAITLGNKVYTQYSDAVLNCWNKGTMSYLNSLK